MGPDATVAKFQQALQVPNSIVGYLDHGYEVNNPQLFKTNLGSVGLCFANNECLVSTEALGLPPGVTYTDPDHKVTFVDRLTFNSTLVFLAICELKDISWASTGMGNVQALIYPTYVASNPAEDMYLPDAAIEWETMLRSIARGDTVSSAVGDGNHTAAVRNAGHRWNSINGKNVSVAPVAQ
jgi:hypothetical protein